MYTGAWPTGLFLQRVANFGQQFAERFFVATVHLLQRQFDLVAVLYNIEGGWGYSNVECLAWSTHANKIRGYFPDGTYRDLSAGAIVKHYLKERTALGWVILNIVTAVFQMILFGLAMTAESLWRRVAPGSPGKQQSTSTTKQS